MRPEQPLTSEGEFLLYLLKVSEGGSTPTWRPDGWPHGELAWVFERQERAALYALGRMRESLCYRVKRLPPAAAGERAFLERVLTQCQGEDGRPRAPRWPASNLGGIVGMVRHRLFTSTKARAA
jgi:hypothetical protein